MRIYAILTALLLSAAPVSATTVSGSQPIFDGRIVPTGRADNQKIYAIDGNRLGLVNLRVNGSGSIINRSVVDDMTASNVLGIYAGRGLARRDPVLGEFDDISDGYTLGGGGRNGRIGRAVWVLWEGSDDAAFTFERTRPNGRTVTRTRILAGGEPTLDGTPEIDLPEVAIAPVPLPAPGLLLLAGLGGLAWAGRKRRAATS
ncbi:MAG: hypothetical protein AAF390_14360 [Pseudomonadota bacterium]